MRSLGKADLYAGSGELVELHYRALGLQVHLYRGALESFEVVFQAALSPAAGRGKLRDTSLELRVTPTKTLQLSSNTHETAVLDALGRPHDKAMIVDLSWCAFRIGAVDIFTYSEPESRKLVDIDVAIAGDDGRDRSPAA